MTLWGKLKKYLKASWKGWFYKLASVIALALLTYGANQGRHALSLLRHIDENIAQIETTKDDIKKLRKFVWFQFHEINVLRAKAGLELIKPPDTAGEKPTN